MFDELTNGKFKDMCISDKLDLVLYNQVRLFYLITQAPGVARYESDEEHFDAIKNVVDYK